MSLHEWSTSRRTDDKQHDECRRCPARRIRGVNTKWEWRYTVLGEKTCAGAHDPSPKERQVIAERRE